MGRLERAQEVRNFICFNKGAVLSTSSASHHGYPFGSIVPYDVDNHGQLIILISSLAEHYKNLAAKPQASLLVSDYFGRDDPQSYARATVLGSFEQVAAAELPEVAKSYCERFPEAVQRSSAHDFDYFRLLPTAVRWIAGFGAIRWVPVEDYLQVKHDEAAYHGLGAVRHMNDDHQEALGKLLGKYSDINCAGFELRMIFVDSTSFVIEGRREDKSFTERIHFPSPVESFSTLREVFIEMLS